MDFLHSHQKREKFTFFGLLASRSLYNRGRHEQPVSAVRAQEIHVDEVLKKTKLELQQNLTDYNATYGRDVSTKDQDFHYETLRMDTGNPDALKKQIEDIIIQLKRKHGDQWQNKLKDNPQYLALGRIKEIITEMQDLPRKGEESVRQSRRTRIHARHEKMSEAVKRKELWKKTDAYKEVISVFDSMAGNAEFAGLFQSPDGLISQNQREARELFLAIMAEQTNGFQTDFALGGEAEFGNNPEENIERYPFLYSEFLKHEGDAVAGDAVSLEAIRDAESKALIAQEALGGETAEDVVQNIQSGGADPNELGPMPAMPNNEGWQERVRILNSWVYRFEEMAANATDMPQKNTYTQVADKIKLHRRHAEINLTLSKLKSREQVVRSKFTRAELSGDPTRRRLVISLAMKKFMKAQQIVDHPYGAKSDWRYNLHPTVRRMLIASTYHAGVASFEEKEGGVPEYTDDPRKQHHWMLSTLVMTDYFNFKEVGDEMDESHIVLLKAAFLGGRVAELLENSQEVRNLLADWIAVLEKQSAITDPAEREKLFREKMGKYPPQYVQRYSQYTKEQAQEALGKVDEDRARLQEFLNEVKAAVENPYSERSQAFITRMKRSQTDPAGFGGEIASETDRLGRMGIIEGENLAAYNRQMFDLEVNFRTAELGEANTLQFFEGLGMKIEGIYPKYLDMTRRNPELKSEHWDRLLLGTAAEFKSLIDLLQAIIPNDKSGGKKDFIQGLYSIRAKYKGKSLSEIQAASLQEGSEDAVIINVMKMLQQHLSERSGKAAYGDRNARDIEKRLNGMHIGDRISYYVGGVWDMLAGPGQSPANRVAGLVLMYGMYKSARLAMKGEGKMGKALRALFVAGSLEIAAKEVTGRGILDRVGMDAIAGAMEGSYEAVLHQDAQEYMTEKEINPDAHAAALYALNDASFHSVVDWYENSDDNGMPRKGVPDKFPRQIDLGKVKKKIGKKFAKEEDLEVEARRVVKETVKHFFRYVGSKDNKRSMEHGKEALKERWVTMYDRRDYDPIYSSYDHREWFEQGGVKKGDITWQLVMRAEIDPSEVDLTRDKTMVGRLTATAREVATEVNEWVREHVYNPGAGLAEKFVSESGEYGQAAKGLVSEVYEKTKRKAYFGKEHVVLWYGEHQYEIRRVAENHWNLFVTGVKMPFKIVYAIDQWAMPWTLAKIEQIEETLRSDKMVPTEPNGVGPLSRADIFKGMNPLILKSRNETVNPHFRYYGIYQEPFLRAFEAKTDPSREMYYKDFGMNVGYYIASATPQDAKINVNAPPYRGDPAARHAAMVIAARDKAERFFRGKGMDPSQISQYMDRIHQVVRTGPPEQVYMFYRMPLTGSIELHLKSIGRWADYRHADQHKDREAFKVEPSQSSWENLKRAFALDMGPARTIISKVTAYAAQIPKFVFWNVEGIGNIIGEMGVGLFGKDENFKDSVDTVFKRPESQRIFMDEAFGSAASSGLAISEFYSNKTNAKLYKFSHEFAIRMGKPLHLGLLEGRDGYEGTMYLEGDIDYGKMLQFYKDNYGDVPNKADPEILTAITAKINAPPPQPGAAPAGAQPVAAQQAP